MTTKVAVDPSARLAPPALLLAVAAISFAAPFFRQAAPTPPLTAAGIRLAVAALLLLPWTWRGGRRRRWAGREFRCALLAGLFYGVHFGAWVTSLTLTSIAASVTLVTVTPLLLAVPAVVTGRDKPDRRLWLCLALAAVGLSVIGGTDLSFGTDHLLGDGLALLGAVAMAGYLLVGRRLGADLDLWFFSGVATAVGAAILLLAALVAGVSLRPATGGALVYLILAALVPQLIGHNLLTWSLRHVRPMTVGMAVLGEPVGAAFLGWIWLGERVTWSVALGCGLTLAAVLAAIRTAPPPDKPPPLR